MRSLCGAWLRILKKRIPIKQLPKPSRLDLTLARIHGIVRNKKVVRAVLKDTHVPNGFRIEPFANSSLEPSETPPASLRQAMRQLRLAEAILFVDLVGKDRICRWFLLIDDRTVSEDRRTRSPAFKSEHFVGTLSHLL